MFPAAILLGLGLLKLGVASLGPLASLTWIVAYWPAALVLLGVWLLFRDSLPAPARRPIAAIGGLALLAYGIVAAAATVAAGGALARTGVASSVGSSPFADTLTLDQPIAPGQTLAVTNSSGSTTIRSGSGSTVHVVATRHSSLGGQPSDVQLTSSGSGVNLEASSRGGGFPFGDSSAVDYAIEVPAAVNVNVRSSSGEVRVSDVTGEVRLATSSGPIEATDLRHLREASTSSGNISLHGVFIDAAQVRTSSGSVDVRLLPGSAIQLDVKSSSGSVVPQGVQNSEYRPGAVPPEMPTLLAGSRADRVKRAQSFNARAQAVAETTRNLIVLEAEDAFLRWEEAALQIQDAREAADAGDKLADDVSKDFTAGLRVKVEDVINSRVLASQARSQYNEYLYRQILALADLERITGGAFSARLVEATISQPATGTGSGTR